MPNKVKVSSVSKSYAKSTTNRRGKTKLKKLFSTNTKTSSDKSKNKRRSISITKNKKEKLISVFTHKDKKTGERYTTYKGKVHTGKKAKRVYKRIRKKIKRKTRRLTR